MHNKLSFQMEKRVSNIFKPIIFIVFNKKTPINNIFQYLKKMKIIITIIINERMYSTHYDL